MLQLGPMNYKSKLIFFSYTNTVLGYSGDSILNELKFLVVFCFFHPGDFEFFWYFRVFFCVNCRLFPRNVYKKMLMVKEKIIRQVENALCSPLMMAELQPSVASSQQKLSTSVFAGFLVHLLMSHLLQLHLPTRKEPLQYI